MPTKEEELIKEIESKFGLLYLENATDGNVCFAINNSEMRDDFKTSFSGKEFKYFLKSFGDVPAVVPVDEKDFWNRVRMGESL